MATQQVTQQTIVEQIARDHRKTDMAIAELEMRLRKQGDDELGPVFAPMTRELLGHMAAEERLLYPLLERGETRDLVTDARKGHAAIRRQLEELTAGGAMERTEWGRRLQVLKQEVQHHATDEEGELLPAARRVLDEQQLRELGSRFERMQGE
jgi:hemerythrin superfamily protein